MERIAGDTYFHVNLKSFIDDIIVYLSSRIDVQVSKISVPQSLICYRVDNIWTSLQLRFVLIPFKNGDVLGRLSWLDQRGKDHTCCYLNKCFDCVVMTSNGDCFKEEKSAESLCFQEFKFLIDESK